MTESLKSENYNPEFQAKVEERQERPMIDIETVNRQNNEGVEEEICVLDIAGVKVESFASRDDIEAVIKEIHLTKEAIEILQAMALTYQQKRGLIIEGETARGKTFLMNKFTELIFGRGIAPVDFYCHGQTDTMSLMSKWVPKTEDPEDEEKWNIWAESSSGRKEFEKIIDGVNNGTIKPEEVQNKFTALVKKAGILKPVSQWKFQYGALPRAMTAGGKGTFMHIQEVGLAETHVIDALLQLGGEKGKIAGEIQLWEDGGRRISSGENFWICYSTNPPENYPNRSGIDQALTRRNTFLKLGEESPSSRQLKQYQDNNIPYEKLPDNLKKEIREQQKDIIFPIEKGSDYNSQEYMDARILVSETVADFHEKLKTAMQEKVIEQRTKQKFEITDDEWNMVYDFMRKFKSFDLEATLDKAVYLHYVSRFTDKGKENAWKLWEQIKKQKDFKQKLEAVLPREAEVSVLEDINELNEFAVNLEQDIKNLKEQIDDFCQAESTESNGK